MRVFLDTNVLAAALGTRGLCADLLATVLEEHELLISEALLTELERVLQMKFKLPVSVVTGYLTLLRGEGVLCQPAPHFAIKCPDPDDTPLLSAALAGQADYFTTGDKALLKFARADKMPIVSPRGLWETLS